MMSIISKINNYRYLDHLSKLNLDKTRKTYNNLCT